MPKTAGRKPDLSRAARRAPGDDPLPVPPGVVGANLEPPPSLRPDARRAWRTVVPYLAKSGALVEADLPYLVQLCNAIAFAEIAAEGYWDAVEEWGMAATETKRARIAWEKAVKVMDTLASQTGANPVARSRLGLNMLRGRSLLALLTLRDQTA